jgi:hypothetical protein
MLQCAFIAHCLNLGAPNPELNTAFHEIAIQSIRFLMLFRNRSQIIELGHQFIQFKEEEFQPSYRKRSTTLLMLARPVGDVQVWYGEQHC